MFRNVLKFYFRNAMSNKFMTFINLFGLAIGMAVFIVVGTYVRHELSYDKFHEKSDRIVRLCADAAFGPDQEFTIAVTSAPMGPAYVREIPAFEKFCRFDFNHDQMPITYGERHYVEKEILCADSSFFQIFSYELLIGDPDKVLTAPNSVVISETTADKYFGDENPIGKELIVNDDFSLNVTGVMADCDKPSHLPAFPMVYAWSTYSGDHSHNDEEVWLNNVNWVTYMLVAEGVDIESLDPLIEASNEKNMGEMLRALGGKYDGWLQPLEDCYLRSDFDYYGMPAGLLQYVYQLGAIGLFSLIIACLNFVNLTTARSTKRGKQIGLSKVMGASRAMLIRQLVAESVVVSIIAMLIAVLLASLALPAFSNLMDVELSLNFLNEPGLIVVLLAIATIVGIIAGGYPALVLSRFQPADVLKGQLVHGNRGTRLRSTLVILQFAVSVVLIVGALVVSRQNSFMRNKDLGYDNHQVYSIIMQNADLMTRHETFINDVKTIPGVIDWTKGDDTPDHAGSNSLYHIPGAGMEEQILIATMRVNHNFLDFMEMNLVDGRHFDPSISSDSTQAIIVNQALANMLNWENPTEMYLEEIQTLDPPVFEPLNVIGVVEDFHFNSLHTEVRPMMLKVYQGIPYRVFFRLETNGIEKTVAQIEKAWMEFAPGVPINARFLDDSFDNLYSTEIRTAKMFNVFTILAILIACLGLFALAVFAAEQRTKEIGIRKVMGATVSGMVRLLTLQFLKLVLISNVIALPFAWYLMDKWLSNFAYRISLTYDIFLITVALSLVIALITVSYQAIRAALTNPIRVLKYE